MIHKLYSLTDTLEKAKEPLYIRGVKKREGNSILMNKGEVLDFTTYFNSLSLKKWKRYTTIKALQLVLHLEGRFQVTFHLYDEKGNVRDISMNTESSCFAHFFAVEELDGVLLGFSLQCISDAGVYVEGHWDGEFTHWEDKKIGVSITTFKRETYVKRTMSLLRDFHQNHPWISVLVVDNGGTLEEIPGQRFRVIHNRNFGGSGGFTRGMIEYVEQGMVDYVLLMDDDIILETSTLERTFSLLSGLKDEYKDSFLAGAMLSLEEPCRQCENTAYWDKIISRICGRNLDLTDADSLLVNETIHNHPNAYAGWWYCCIPVKRIVDIGYPIPAFIKSDDMEYGIRNHKEILSINGIGVWHQAFATKMNPAIRYFSDRNSFILNHYAFGCGRGTLMLAVLGRIIKRLVHGDTKGIAALSSALYAYMEGFDRLTSQPADAAFAEIRCQPFTENLGISLLNIARNAIRIIRYYNRIDYKYKSFRQKKLADPVFWKNYLRI